MALTVTQRPLITSPNTSRWNGAGNPIIYKFKREDFQFDEIVNDGGLAFLKFNGVDLTASFRVGDTLYFKSNDGNYEATSIGGASVLFMGDTLVNTNVPYTVLGGAGFVNNNTLRSLYKIGIEVYNSNDELLSEQFLYSVNSLGFATCDISRIISANLSADLDFDLTGGTQVFEDTNVFTGFYIKYREVWRLSSETQTDDVSNTFYAVYGARQIPSTYGGNYLEYAANETEVLINDTAFNTNWTNEGTGVDWTLGATNLEVSPSEGVSKRARRLVSASSGDTLEVILNISTTDDIRVRVYLSNSQSIDFGIIGPGTANYTEEIVLTSTITYLEIEADDTITVTSPTVNINDVDVNLISFTKFLTRLTTPVMWRDWPFLLSVIVNEDVANNVYLEVGADTSASADQSGKLVDYDLNQILTDQTVSTVDVTLFEDSAPDVQLSEVLTIELRTECDNPVMLLGRNSLGGCLQWMFDFSQEYTFDYGNNIKAKRHLLFAKDLTLNQWEALNDFFTLGQVYRNNIVEFTSATNKTSSRIGQQVYVLNQDGTKIGVIVIPTKNTTNTRQVKHTFEIEIEYPETFTV